MDFKTISLFAINATVFRDATPTGKTKYIIKLDYDAGTAIDRILDCNDFRYSGLSNKEDGILKNGIFYVCNRYITYSFFPKDQNSVYCLTCDCSHTELNEEESHKQIKLGMDKAFQKLNETIKKSQ